MKNKKAVIVTLAMTAMLIVILICLVLLKSYIPFGVIVGAFFGIGVGSSASALHGWLGADEDIEIPSVVADDAGDEVPPEVTATIEEIMEEVRA